MFSFSKKNLPLQDVLFLTALSSFFLIFQLGSGSLASWDEAVYASVAREIFQSGNWLQLTFNGEPWSDKPPLAIWVTAFFYHLFGVNEFSARLFSALCGVGTVVATYLVGQKLFNRWIGFLGALVLLSSSHFIRCARFGMLDAPLTFFMTLSLYFFWRGYERNRYLIFSGIAAGLAIMVKGFGGFLIFPITWLYCIFSGEYEILLRSSYWVGLMVAAGIALPWNLYEMMSHGSLFMREVVVKHLFQRTFTVLDGHKGNFYFYIRTLVNKYHPWVLIGLFSAPFFLFKAIKERVGGALYLAVWMFFVFAVFTLTQTKLAHYILPIYPALSLTVGYVLARIFKENHYTFIRIVFIGIMVLHVPYSHIFDFDYSRNLKGIAPLVRSELPPGEQVFLYNYHENNAVTFYMTRVSSYLDTPDALATTAGTRKSFFVLILDRDREAVRSLIPKLGLKEAGSFEDLTLFSKTS